MDLLGLPSSTELGTSQNGVSLRAAFEQPHANHSAAKPFAYSQYPRCGAGPPPPLPRVRFSPTPSTCASVRR